MSEPRLIEPLVRRPDAVVNLPGSKSITNRALVAAALADGRSTLTGVLFADDTWAMIHALTSMGAVVSADPEQTMVDVVGCAGPLPAGGTVDANQSGTTGRFVIPVAALSDESTVIDGHPQLRGRPMADLVDALAALGAAVDELGEAGHLPLRVTGPIVGSEVEVRGDASSQFLSGLLLAGGATSGLTVSVVGELVSQRYVAMTTAVMEAFGAAVSTPAGKWVVGGGYSGTDYAIEPDASAASYFLAAAAITGGTVRVDGLGSGSLQGDVMFASVLGEMGADVQIGDDHVTVTGPDQLRGAHVDLGAISDTAPTLAVAAAFADGPTTVEGIGFIRDKESDRIAGPVTELRRAGVDAEETDDGFVVRPSGGQLPSAATFETYDDHRMAMAFALIGLMVEGVHIAGSECVNKTFPDYFRALDQLR